MRIGSFFSYMGKRLQNFCGGLPRLGLALRLAFTLNTILDKIIEFAKSSFGSDFVSEQRFDSALRLSV